MWTWLRSVLWTSRNQRWPKFWDRWNVSSRLATLSSTKPELSRLVESSSYFEVYARPPEVAIGPKTRYTLAHWNGKRFSTFPLNDLAPTLKKNSQCLIFFMEVSWFTSYNVRGYRGWADKNRRYKLKAFHFGRSISGRGEESKAWRFKNAIYRSFVRFYDENNSQDSSWFSLEIHGCIYDKNITENRIFFFCSYFSIQRIEKAKTYTSRLRTTRMDLNKTKRIARRKIFCCQRSFMDKLYDDEQVIYWIFLMSINRFELLLISCEWKMNVSWSGENYTSKWDESIRIWNKLQKIMEISERNA